jgi:hypothetical protein
MNEISPAQIAAVKCPTCNAEPHQLCTGTRGKPRTEPHRERWQAAELERAMRRHPAYTEPETTILEIDGHVAYPLTDETRKRGLEAIAHIRDQIRQRKDLDW